MGPAGAAGAEEGIPHGGGVKEVGVEAGGGGFELAGDDTLADVEEHVELCVARPALADRHVDTSA